MVKFSKNLIGAFVCTGMLVIVGCASTQIQKPNLDNIECKIMIKAGKYNQKHIDAIPPMTVKMWIDEQKGTWKEEVETGLLTQDEYEDLVKSCDDLQKMADLAGK